jgi:hypothetical protein
MAELPSFGVLLTRLMEHRGLDSRTLSNTAEISESQLRALLNGAAPDPPESPEPPDAELLERLAPAIDLHTADLFVIAGLDVPEGLAPVEAAAGKLLPDLVREFMHLSPESRRRLRQIVQSMPQADRTEPAAEPPTWERHDPGLGAMLVRLFRNRNMSHMESVRVLFLMTGIGLSRSTLGMVGDGRKELSPELLADFATVLGIPAEDLAALTDIELPAGSPAPPHPATTGVAELLWDVRRLTTEQLQEIHERAESMREQ